MSDFEARHIQKVFHQEAGAVRVLEDVSVELSGGQSLSIVGQSGVGKSTLLHCLGLLDTIDRGEILFGNEIVSKGGETSTQEKHALVRRRSIGFVFQFHYLMSELTALENVMLPLLMERVNQDEAESRAKEILESVGLGHRLKHRPSKLSGGEQQRVAIARALVHNPKLILADEPTGNLDPKTAESVFNVLKDQSLRLKAILIMATHHLDLATHFDKRATLVGGRLI